MLATPITCLPNVEVLGLTLRHNRVQLRRCVLEA